jgi:hypothetical protein
MQDYVSSVWRNWCPIAQVQPLNPHHPSVDPSYSDSDSPAGVYLCFSGFLPDPLWMPPSSHLTPRTITSSATLRL